MLETSGVAKLRAAGFTLEQIERLTALKARYPVCEYVVSRAQLERLTFLRWLYASANADAPH
jgi:hypothetical protein